MVALFLLEPGICISSLLFSSSSIFFSPKLPHLLLSSSPPPVFLTSVSPRCRRPDHTPTVPISPPLLHRKPSPSLPRSALNHPHNIQSFPHHNHLSFISNRSKQPASSTVCSHTSQPPSSAPRSRKPSHLVAPRFLPPTKLPFPLLLYFPSRPQAASTIAAGLASSEQPAISIRRRRSFPLRHTCSRRGFSLHRRAAGLFVSSTVSGSAPASASSDPHELLPLLSTAGRASLFSSGRPRLPSSAGILPLLPPSLLPLLLRRHRHLLRSAPSASLPSFGPRRLALGLHNRAASPLWCTCAHTRVRHSRHAHCHLLLSLRPSRRLLLSSRSGCHRESEFLLTSALTQALTPVAEICYAHPTVHPVGTEIATCTRQRTKLFIQPTPGGALFDSGFTATIFIHF